MWRRRRTVSARLSVERGTNIRSPAPRPSPLRCTRRSTHRHLARDPRVVHLEPRDVPGHRVVPGDLAAVHQHGQGGGGERLPDRAELEDRVRVDGRVVAQPAGRRSRAPASPGRSPRSSPTGPGRRPPSGSARRGRRSPGAGRPARRRRGTRSRPRERPLSTIRSRHRAGRYEPQNLVPIRTARSSSAGSGPGRARHWEGGRPSPIDVTPRSFVRFFPYSSKDHRPT